jgi:hypothetical protein
MDMSDTSEYYNAIRTLITFFKDGDKVRIDAEDINKLCAILNVEMNHIEGNITKAERHVLLTIASGLNDAANIQKLK